jgi:hypothetical protein
MKDILLINNYEKEEFISKSLINYFGYKLNSFDEISYSEFLSEKCNYDYNIIIVLFKVFDADNINNVTNILEPFSGKLIFHCLHINSDLDFDFEVQKLPPLSQTNYEIYLTDTLCSWKNYRNYNIFYSPSFLSFYMKHLQQNIDINIHNIASTDILLLVEKSDDNFSHHETKKYIKTIASIFDSGNNSIFKKLFKKKTLKPKLTVVSLNSKSNNLTFLLENKLKKFCKINHIENSNLNLQDLLNIAKNSNFCVSTGYYSTLIALNCGIPTFPIYTTEETFHLLDSRNCDFGFNYINSCNITKKFVEFSNFKELCIGKLPDEILIFEDRLFTEIQEIIDSNEECILQKEVSVENIYTVLKNTAKNTFNKDNLWDITDKENILFMAKIASYMLTQGRQDSPYLSGLVSKICTKNYNYKEEFKFVICDYSSKIQVVLPSNPKGIINCTFIDQWDYNSLHRSGWQYVFENLISLNNVSAPLICDFYLDRTFGWNLKVNKITGVIPYIKPWIGFIHHTFENNVSEYNCNKLFKAKEFITSLKYCKGLFVLSNYLKNDVEKALIKLCLDYVPVTTIYHPTEFVSSQISFDWEKFIENKDKKVIHVGGWLRNIYFFYRLDVPSVFSKVALKWKFMNNYFPTQDFKNELLQMCIQMTEDDNKDNPGNISREPNVSVNPNVSCDPDLYLDEDDDEGDENINNKEILCCRNKVPKNTFIKCFLEDSWRIFDSVELYQDIQDSEYDKLLTCNVVFINLIDASAVNAVIECIVRNCPIIVNAHPAVIEVLGKKYPLLYETQYEAQQIFSDINKIKLGYEYLVKMDKSFLKISVFKRNFINALSLIS